ncbi:2-hydroxychromene-2-carboxylate isomerase [Nioella nitratireducens]|uniref:2-hydroxychromene-2-carboxylate isomerase n=1 Tax=Nioella nitratireducens TaxID=1287720 RepID=UPI0008FCFB07|nr:2-hydroxychromene-2-carboxylate isomerase [Nioella nitratireducens]
MAQIDYYFSTLSPFTYLAGTRLEEIAARRGADVTYKPMDIMTLFTRTGGVAPKDRHPARMAYRAQELRRGQLKSGLPLNIKPMFWPTNPAPSSYAIITAQQSGDGDLGGLVHGILRAVWSEEKDIAESDVIRTELEDNGFDPDLADKGMLSAAEEYARNLEEAVAANVFGAPFYVVDGAETFWGHDRLDDLDLFLSGKL